jgi:DNA-binding transcriptional MerR regulator
MGLIFDHQAMPIRRKTDSAGAAPLYRSGAVARMLRMPVSTLRIWEQRYRVVAPATTASGHRLYTAADVQRLALLRQLSAHGHAIGAIAALDSAQLQQVASTHAGTQAAAAGAQLQQVASTHAGTQAAAAGARRPAPWRLVVVGAALARRLQRLQQVPAQVPASLQVFDTLAEAAGAADGRPIDLLLWHAPSLQAAARDELQAAADAWAAPRTAVAYRYAGAAARDAFTRSGIRLWRETAVDAALAAFLARLRRSPVAPDGPWPLPDEPARRRFDDATLTDLAGLSSTIACECPRHVAELLMQLAQFEAYSAECRDRSPDDAALHDYLRRVAGAARALFEGALERVAVQEGLVLPG